MICNQCNNTIPADSEFCSYCGNMIKKQLQKSNVEKGFAYLELKQWDKANALFDASIVDGADKSRAYIGRLLSRLRLAEFSALATVKKDLLKYDDFQMALKYADAEYEEQLNNCLEQNDKTRKERKAKRKKRAVISCAAIFCVAVLAVLSYYVAIPYGRFTYYKNQLAKGNAQKAAKAYTNSRWFEYDNKAKELFYQFGVDFTESENYKEAEACFAVTKGYKDSENYYNYCKGRALLDNEDLDSYNYFIKCRGFLDTDTILTANTYLSQLEILQGEWHHPTIKMWKSEAEYLRYMRSKGYVEVDGKFYIPEIYKPNSDAGMLLSSYDEYKPEDYLKIKGNSIKGKSDKGKLIIRDGKIRMNFESLKVYNEGEDSVSIISNDKFLFDKYFVSSKVIDIEWTRVN